MIKIIENFITEEEEKEMLSQITPSKVKAGKARNSIKRYGSALPYASKIKSATIPPIYQIICERIAENKIADLPDSVTINEYLEDQAIDWHIDSQSSGPIIIVLSLLSQAEMGLRKQSTNENTIHKLPPRSLLILSGEERDNWQHCIFPVQNRRYSVVFRKGTRV